ncbi:signal recognition particle 9 kDa protein isoform X2 [Hypanus sabinus]|uniref:signal recognition particle 9 kDa protein isoform X2 n=1 Tax=Hypanus sabinus TaxID=79690 RepID=UPI0028C496E8|nr:signal recognition particle 9 kDa protein isoform X2 [Hypanus sabinus]
MTYIPSWEEFVRAAEKLCLTEGMKVRVVIKYRHCAGLLSMKCLQYKTDQAQDVKKFEKFQNQLMRVMVSRECRSSLMEME